MEKGANWSDTCNKWVEKFSIQTNSKWVVKATFPKVQRIEYRKVYFCKENSVSSRNHNKSCPAKIDVKIKKSSVHTIRKDQLLKTGYNAEIKVHLADVTFFFIHSLLACRSFSHIHMRGNKITKARMNVYFNKQNSLTRSLLFSLFRALLRGNRITIVMPRRLPVERLLAVHRPRRNCQL